MAPHEEICPFVPACSNTLNTSDLAGSRGAQEVAIARKYSADRREHRIVDGLLACTERYCFSGKRRQPQLDDSGAVKSTARSCTTVPFRLSPLGWQKSLRHLRDNLETAQLEAVPFAIHFGNRQLRTVR